MIFPIHYGDGVQLMTDDKDLERQYRNNLSGYLRWDQLPHAEDYLLFEKNIGICGFIKLLMFLSMHTTLPVYT